MNNKQHKYLWVILSISFPCLFVLDVLFGSVSIPLSDFLSYIQGDEISTAHEVIISQSRLPKAITAVICGSALSIAGLLMQTLFRNPLAGPYMLGVSSGAGLGVALIVMGVGFLGIQIQSTIPLTVASFIGSVAVLLLLFIASLKVKDVMTLLILGVMIGSVATAFTGIVQYFTSDAQLKDFLIWTLGSLDGVSYQELIPMFFILIIGVLIALLASKQLNALTLGERYAKSIGVNINSCRILAILSSALLAAMVTAYCGPIGFVGIIIPHLCRLIFQTTNHYILIPSSILLGSSVLLFADIICYLPAKGISLPINSITSIIGIPIIVWIIFNKRSISSSF